MRHDDAYLLDMLVAARKASTFVEGLTFEQFVESDLHNNAVVKVLEIIGEAASRVSEATQDAHPEIPWREIIGLRNRIVHVYFEIDLDIVWNIVNDDVPTLIRELERIAPPDSQWRPEEPSTG